MLKEPTEYARPTFWQYFSKNKSLYVMLIPGLVCLLLFRYAPMWGLIISFQHYHPGLGIAGSKWVGLKHFIDFFNDPYTYRIIRNTILLGGFTILFSFPVPIIFALILNEIGNTGFKRVSQTISYLPYFLSIVVVIGLLRDITGVTDGVINAIIAQLGMEKIPFFIQPEWFRPLYIVSDIWQHVGFGSIIYLAAISGINPELYESAVVDGADRFSQIWRITIPSILPTIIILLILRVGDILGNDFQKILLMYSPFTWETADVISTYIYRVGIESQGSNFSYGTAVGFFSSIVSLVFLTATNKIAKSLSEYSLW